VFRREDLASDAAQRVASAVRIGERAPPSRNRKKNWSSVSRTRPGMHAAEGRRAELG
jgi:hypothetical protein